MKTQVKFRVPSVPVFGESESLTKLKGSKSSARAHEHLKVRDENLAINMKTERRNSTSSGRYLCMLPRMSTWQEMQGFILQVTPDCRFKHKKISKKDCGLSQRQKTKSSGERKRGEHHIFK